MEYAEAAYREIGHKYRWKNLIFSQTFSFGGEYQDKSTPFMYARKPGPRASLCAFSVSVSMAARRVCRVMGADFCLWLLNEMV